MRAEQATSTAARAPVSPRRLRLAMVAVALTAMIAAAAGIGVPSLPGEQLAVDEPQYWFTALSIAEDADLDISNQLAEERWREYTEIPPWAETLVLEGGRQISPHDPLLALVLALPVALGGLVAANGAWVAAKLTLAVIGGVLAATTLWTAVRRFAVPLPLAATGVAVAAASAPLAVYGQQIYPELPAALICLLGVVALTGQPPGEPRRPQLLLLVASVIALPWLSVKYAPVAAVLAGLAALHWWRAGRRTEVLAVGGGLAAMGALYLVVHRSVWGGWTAYASGDHFEHIGEFAVVGVDPDYLVRTMRLVGLWVDQDYGLAAWQPAWLLVIPAVAALLARPPGRMPTAALLLPLLTGWLVATFLAATMHGWWWPGRQTVVVLPLALLAVLWWLANSGTTMRVVAALLGVAGVSTYAALLRDGWAGEIVWVNVEGYAHVDALVHQALRVLLPAHESYLAHTVWGMLFGLLAVAAYARSRTTARTESTTSPG